MLSLRRSLFSATITLTLALLFLPLMYSTLTEQVQAATIQAPEARMQTDISNCSPCYHFYGSKHNWMYQATGDWYQQEGNWCGIASIRAIQRYDWLYYDGGNPQWDNSQGLIYNRLNSYTSPWGSGGGYVTSDISGDFGTDPHSVVYGTWYDTPPSTQPQPYWFHNWIYRTNATTATNDFSTDFGTNTVSHDDPITLMIDAGYHSFVISGFSATSDPSLGKAKLKSIQTWDPWLNHANNSPDGTHPYNQTEEEVWSITDWTTLGKLWGQGYGNNSDPEPDTSNNYYVPPFPGYNVPHHWNTYFVTIEQDRINNDSTSFDYAIDQNGHLAPHN
jgi:hypothetical protein